MKRGPRGLGKQAAPVLAAPRRAPGVLAKIGAPASPEAQAIRALQVTNRKLLDEQERLLADLSTALDGWEGGAPQEEQPEIDAMRKRWGIGTDRKSGEARDLTDDTAES